MNTENWNQITSTFKDDALYREYDKLVGITLLTLCNLSVGSQTIRLYRFNRKDKEHMYILRVALIARDLYDFPIEIDASWWDIFCLNWKLRKGFNKVKKYRLKEGVNDSNGVNVPIMLDTMRGDAVECCGEDFTFANIYEAYYERKM